MADGKGSVHTSLGVQLLGQELHEDALKWGGHLVGVFELVARPTPELLHVGGRVVGMVGTVLGDLCGHFGLKIMGTLSTRALRQEPDSKEVYRKGQNTGQHL